MKACTHRHSHSYPHLCVHDVESCHLTSLSPTINTLFTHIHTQARLVYYLVMAGGLPEPEAWVSVVGEEELADEDILQVG